MTSIRNTTARPAVEGTGPDSNGERPQGVYRPGDPSHEPGPASNHGDKLSILTKGRASVVSSIADAVIVKDRDLFFAVPRDGSVPCHPGHGFGLYYHDCRFLRGYELRIGGRAAQPLAATAAAGSHGVLELTTPEIELEDGRTLPKEQIGIRWKRQVDGDGLSLRDELAFRNYGVDDAEVPVSLSFDAAFEDVFAIRGLLDEQPGKRRDPVWHGRDLVFSYAGADGIERTTTIAFDPPPLPPGPGGPTRPATEPGWRLQVRARGSQTIKVSVSVAEASSSDRANDTTRNGGAGSNRGGASGGNGREMQSWLAALPQIRSDSLLLNGLVDRSLQDLRTLLSGPPGSEYFAAGVPWFVTLFGRDSLITALQMLAFDSGMVAETLRTVAALQGTITDSWRDEQPGKMLHSVRRGELANLNAIPHTPYYGSVDATPLFAIVLARAASWTGDLSLFHELRDHLDRALDWIRDFGDVSGHGWLEYDSERAPDGLINQGWKDSGNGIVNALGEIATPPIALAEVQGYAYAAFRGAAELYRRDGDEAKADALDHEADDLRQRFEAAFWLDDEGCFDMALQRGTDGTHVVTSNAGQVLWTGLASEDRARSTTARLMRDDMFTGWGIRTLSTAARRYDPIGYHLGTVWPHDTALIAEGMRHYGCDDEALRLAEGIIEAATDFPHLRLPEVFAGFDRSEFGVPVRYPVACHPQAWAAGAVPHLLTTMLGLEPDAFDRRLRIVRPQLPSFVHRLEVRGLHVGDAQVDLLATRTERGVEVTVTDVRGSLHVEVKQAPRPAGRAEDGSDSLAIGTTDGQDDDA